MENSFKEFYEFYDFNYDESIIKWSTLQKDITSPAIPNVICLQKNQELTINCLLDPKVLTKKLIMIEFTCKHHNPGRGTFKPKHEKLTVNLLKEKIIVTKDLHHFTANQILN